MLTSVIIIVGGLGAFLVLNEIDAGTLAALRVTLVSLASFFAYRAATVVAVTTVYVVARSLCEQLARVKRLGSRCEVHYGASSRRAWQRCGLAARAAARVAPDGSAARGRRRSWRPPP